MKCPNKTIFCKLFLVRSQKKDCHMSHPLVGWEELTQDL